MDKSDRVRACLRYVQREFLTNVSLPERFSVAEKNKAAVSRHIREAVKAGMIRPVGENSARNMMKYKTLFFRRLNCWVIDGKHNMNPNTEHNAL